MKAIEIARKLAGSGQKAEACQAYSLVIQTEDDPAAKLEAAAYILQVGGDYKISYTTFVNLYDAGCFREDILPLMRKVFYEPNVRLLKSRYERNCKLLQRYPYIFRKDFLKFEDLPICFFPYDDHSGYVPFYRAEDRFGNFINFKDPVISRNFFRDLEDPILADDVYSQYELEYLIDNVRRSEDVARENHIYLHYTDWAVFCSYLQCLSLRRVLESKKLVFLIEDELAQYPIDFKERFGIDYSRFTVQPVRIREVHKLIWHAQMSTHNGGDFFNEIFDSHPNLLMLPSIMFDNFEENAGTLRTILGSSTSLKDMFSRFEENSWPTRLAEELYHMKDPTDKDLLVALYLQDERATAALDKNARIVPAVFFQPHFPSITYNVEVDADGQATLYGEHEEKLGKSSLFRNFKYIKTFMPMRRPTTSHGATVKFMYQSALKPAGDEKKKTYVVSDALSERILNRNYMIDWQNRLYKDSVLVRFEDGKLNPKATFTALAAFLDIPYTESMTYCSVFGEVNGESLEGNDRGFDPAAIYRTYDEYVNDSERYFIEYFLRDTYEFYGYSFHYYDGKPVDEEKVTELIDGFTTIDHYIRETWRKVYQAVEVSLQGERVSSEIEQDVQEKLLESYIKGFHENRLKNAKGLLRGLNFINRRGQPLRMMPKLELDPALLEQPLYH